MIVGNHMAVTKSGDMLYCSLCRTAWSADDQPTLECVKYESSGYPAKNRPYAGPRRTLGFKGKQHVNKRRR